jgi:hypothetical protein
MLKPLDQFERNELKALLRCVGCRVEIRKDGTLKPYRKARCGCGNACNHSSTQRAKVTT